MATIYTLSQVYMFDWLDCMNAAFFFPSSADVHACCVARLDGCKALTLMFATVRLTWHLVKGRSLDLFLQFDPLGKHVFNSVDVKNKAICVEETCV